eukprot:CAMPEP_0204390388 /NCGR_PEP_ID=MMETSP0469-20131031/60677_1 /ASSEMBLY_ACC=CAM_ASM_000384 /TAXON_ID=2969 /ORGANISM="Oxyrrhis marina" /LENGTH=263 /DNA_ID=CAMNT_0051384255 /DNA_START=27 /DNA_END=818 /DNA_ORIENTATION=-
MGVQRLALGLLAALAAAAAPSEGWNDRIKWLRLKEAEQLARKEKRPMMVLIHQNWCGACKALKPQFVGSKDVEKLSNHFLMVNAGNEQEPMEGRFRPEGLKGGYYPRIIFLSPQGQRIEGVVGPNPEYKAFYNSASTVVDAMKTALQKSGVDLNAEERKRLAAEKAQADAAQAKHQSTVPAMLQEIFNRIDSDHDKVLTRDEFAVMITKMGGKAPDEKQYLGMCTSYGVPAGLTFEKMSEVYMQRGPDEIRNVYDKVVGKTEL